MNKHRIAIGGDHGGFEMKGRLASWLKVEGYEVFDVGAKVFNEGDDYPDFSYDVAQMVAGGRATRGIIICGSGVGACIVANKVPKIRASVCHDLYSAGQGVQHDDMNVLCLGARVIDFPTARELCKVFLDASFSSEPKYRRRLEKVLQIEAKALLVKGR